MYSPTSDWTAGALTSGNGLANLNFVAPGNYVVYVSLAFTNTTPPSTSYCRFEVFGGSFTMTPATTTSGYLPVILTGTTVNDGGTGVNFVISGSFPIKVNSASSFFQAKPAFAGATVVACLYAQSYVYGVRIG
jgi:hypothetical protein